MNEQTRERKTPFIRIARQASYLVTFVLKAFIVASLGMFLLSQADGGSTLGRSAKSLFLSDDLTASVEIALSGTVLSFPMKPAKVILGKPGTFGIEYVDRDLVITPLTPAARSHLFVYLYGRRFSFDLAASVDGSAIIRIHDAESEPGRKEGAKPRAKKTLGGAPVTRSGS